MKSSSSSTVFAPVNSGRSTSVIPDALRGVSTTNSGRITKSSQETESETVEQMRVCFARLEELVSRDATGTGSNRQHQSQAGDHNSRVQLLQNVIDYILDLESTLDFRPDDAAIRSSEQSAGNGWRFNFDDDDEENMEGANRHATEVKQKLTSDFIDRRVSRPSCSDRRQTDAVFGTC